jgi:hypothetical protein
MLHLQKYFTEKAYGLTNQVGIKNLARFFRRGSNSNQPKQPTLVRNPSVTQFVRTSRITGHPLNASTCSVLNSDEAAAPQSDVDLGAGLVTVGHCKQIC